MLTLSKIELRVLGCLLEKSVTTPDQYPMTLNAIINACNQKSSRDPVMNLGQGEVQRALRLLEDKLLVSTDPNLRGRVEKYQQRFCKPPFGMFEFDDGQYALLTVLFLRGAQTPGELRTRTDRLHKFADNETVTAALESLRDMKPDGLVVQLSREPGRRDACWAHSSVRRPTRMPRLSQNRQQQPRPAPDTDESASPPGRTTHRSDHRYGHRSEHRSDGSISRARGPRGAIGSPVAELRNDA